MVKTTVLTMMLAAGASVGMALTPQEAADAAMARAEELNAAAVRATGELEAMLRQHVVERTVEMGDGTTKTYTSHATPLGVPGEVEETSHYLFECILVEDGGRIVNASVEETNTYNFSEGSDGEWFSGQVKNGQDPSALFKMRMGHAWGPGGYFAQVYFGAKDIDESAFDGSGEGVFTVETVSDEGSVISKWEIRDGQALLHESTVETPEKFWNDLWSEFEMIDGHWTPTHHESEEKTSEGVMLKHQVYSNLEFTMLTPEELEAQLARPVADVVAELHASSE